ncbi:MAG: flagellar hook protein FlgE [Acidobacteriota bacterium]|nr:flagellar hook protein FlgE [Acidobacteriota bacterium]
MGFSTSLSGLYANQHKLNVIGNNLANLNTVGFKSSSVQFMDLVSQSVGSSSRNPTQIGLGVTLGSISPNFRQGGIETTGIATNVAIQGEGFFLIGDAENRSYTRAGDFSFDANGILVTPDGQPVQGYTNIDPATGAVITTNEPGNIVITPGALRPPNATTQFKTITNLDSGAAVGTAFTTSVQIYDSLGQSHVATITYTKTGVGAWGYTVSVPGEDVAGGTAGTPSQIATGTVSFDAQGRLQQVNGGAAADVVITSPAWSNGAAPSNLTWDLVDANGTASLTGFGSKSATSSTTQNGSPAGRITALGINADGEILASFGAGTAVVIGQLAVANFNNPEGLNKLGSNRFAASEASGLASVGTAGTGGRGSLTGGAVEQSNVDIAQEFTQMILAQRGYQANSKSITVADELLVETLNLKR